MIDAQALTHVRRIRVDGSVESVRLTPDGTHLFAGTPKTPVLQGIDVVSHDSVTWRVSLDAGVETMDFVKSSDGSTRYIVAQLGGQHGFTVIDFGTRQVVERVELPGASPGEASSYGLAFGPDQDTLWVASSHDGSVVAYGVPSRCRPGRPLPPGQRCAWEWLEAVPVGGRPVWLTMTPDGKSLYVSLAGENAAAVVDTATMAAVSNGLHRKRARSKRCRHAGDEVGETRCETGCFDVQGAWQSVRSRCVRSRLPPRPSPRWSGRFTETVQPFVKRHCTMCHGGARPTAQFDLERYETFETVVEGHAHWALVMSRLEAGDMPPREPARATGRGTRKGDRLDRCDAGSRGAAPGGRPGDRLAAAAEQRRVQLHHPRSDRRGRAPDAGNFRSIRRTWKDSTTLVNRSRCRRRC